MILPHRDLDHFVRDCFHIMLSQNGDFAASDWAKYCLPLHLRKMDSININTSRQKVSRPVPRELLETNVDQHEIISADFTLIEFVCVDRESNSLDMCHRWHRQLMWYQKVEIFQCFCVFRYVQICAGEGIESCCGAIKEIGNVLRVTQMASTQPGQKILL